jgi:hypothetical protein
MTIYELVEPAKRRCPLVVDFGGGLAIAHLMRPQAEHAHLHMSVCELLASLARIEETVLLYRNGGKGRPRAQRMLTDMVPVQQQLAEIFNTVATHPRLTTCRRVLCCREGADVDR